MKKWVITLYLVTSNSYSTIDVYAKECERVSERSFSSDGVLIVLPFIIHDITQSLEARGQK